MESLSEKLPIITIASQAKLAPAREAEKGTPLPVPSTLRSAPPAGYSPVIAPPLTLGNVPAATPSKVAPESLPQEIKDILITTGYWPLVKDNVRQITLLTVSPKNDMGSEDSADAELRQVSISTLSKKGNPLPAWHLALKLVHEAAHVAWRDQPPELQTLTADEGNAYAKTLDFTYKYEEKYGLPNNKKAFLYERVKADQAVKTAKFILTSGGDTEFYPTHPHPRFLAKEIDPALSEGERVKLYQTILMAKVEALAVQK